MTPFMDKSLNYPDVVTKDFVSYLAHYFFSAIEFAFPSVHEQCASVRYDHCKYCFHLFLITTMNDKMMSVYWKDR